MSSTSRSVNHSPGMARGCVYSSPAVQESSSALQVPVPKVFASSSACMTTDTKLRASICLVLSGEESVFNPMLDVYLSNTGPSLAQFDPNERDLK